MIQKINNLVTFESNINGIYSCEKDVKSGYVLSLGGTLAIAILLNSVSVTKATQQSQFKPLRISN
ncbi:MAG: hypothetical protein ACFB02_08415 [Mastigocoleus sp.]